MFSGVGGFELGIGNKGECIGFSEIDKYASELLKKKFPNIKNYGDAKKINPNELPDFDLLCGGFPCQSFSIAGKRRGFSDTRGTMFFEIARIIEVKRPKNILLENVKGLLNHEEGKTFSIIISTLSQLGYDVQWMVLNSKFFGVPQNRERVFIIGNLRGTSRPEILPFRKSSKNINEEFNPGVPTSQSLRAGYYKGGQGTHIKAVHSLYPRSSKTNKGGTGHLSKEPDDVYALDTGNMQGIEILDLYNKKSHSDRSPALTEPHHNTLRVREGTKIRRLTPIECERLQGFPDGWTEGFSDTQRYKMMGNAVTTKVVEAIANKLCA